MVTQLKSKSKGEFKHKWTDEEREIVRRDYQGTNESALRIALKLSYQTGEKITLYAVKGQCARMGILPDKSPPWTEWELSQLRMMIDKYPLAVIARKLHRSINAVTVKSQRLHLSRRVRDGWYTKKEVCEILGVDHKKVQRWIDSGALMANWHSAIKPQQNGGAMWHIEESDLKDFIISHCGELNGRNVDLFQVVNVLVPNHPKRIYEP